MTRLEVREVTVRFGGVTAVDKATISAEGGQVTALIGPNGAGKTTLFNVVTGLQRPSGGKVLLDGKDITHTPTHRRARHGIARTFQRLEAFGSLTVEENIRVAADAVRTKNAKPAQVTRGLIRRIGLERYADARADSVPTGVARLVELARALAIDPELLLLDEPSSGLSEAETASFGELLRDLAAQGRAVLIVEHDMGLIMRVSDAIHVLDRGRLIASGTPVEVQADPVVRKAYLGEDGAGDDGGVGGVGGLGGLGGGGGGGGGVDGDEESDDTAVLPAVADPEATQVVPPPLPKDTESGGWF